MTRSLTVHSGMHFFTPRLSSLAPSGQMFSMNNWTAHTRLHLHLEYSALVTIETRI